MSLYALIAIAFLAASSAPTPLYPIYQDELAASPIVMTVVFATYPVALMLALLTGGSLSNHWGRRAVVSGALGLQIVAVIVFLSADSATLLVTARALQGFATGAATSAFGAALVDLHETRGSVTNSIVPIAGMALGALGSSIVVATSSVPATSVFTILLVVFGVLLATSFFLPETTTPRPGALQSLAPRVRIPGAARGATWTVAPVLVAVWAVGGFVMSLGPNLAGELTGSDSALLGGWLVFAVAGTGAVTVLALMRRPAMFAFITGSAALAAGLGMMVAATFVDSTWMLYAGAVVSGYGFGAGFQGALRTVLPLAGAAERAGLLAGVYVISYLANALPSIGAGIVDTVWGLRVSVDVFGTVVIALALIGLIGMARSSRVRGLQPESAGQRAEPLHGSFDVGELGVVRLVDGHSDVAGVNALERQRRLDAGEIAADDVDGVIDRCLRGV
ncbi:MFS family permease [Spelaeicoccus albus]|uniref:MFS family permease n=1 Tax=Spelaeicoccus albus TaxID=1280376 RepID=A0A7Z0D016_9MICO|nr:MFS family permease [Spelaeicoccus albus]